MSLSLTWTTRYATGNGRWQAICWSAEQDKFVAIADYGTNRAMTSQDGITWTEHPEVPAAAWRSVCWGKEANLFVAVANYSTTTTRIMTSQDGINWEQRTYPHSNNEFFDVCWSPLRNRFVVVVIGSTDNNSDRVLTSTDGISWANQATPANNSWCGVCWSPLRQRFVAVAYGGTNDKRVMTSSDGFTWNLQTPASTNSWVRVCWSPLRSLFVAVADSGNDDRVMTSPDGFTWTGSSVPGAQFRGICWSEEAELFVGTCWGGTYRIYTSSDGFTWNSQVPSDVNGWYAPCWSKERNMFAVVNHGNRVMTADGPTVPSAPRTLTATAGNSQVILNWAIPSSNGGSTIIEYIVIVNSVEFTNSITTSITINGLNNGTSYTFSVKARNTIGYSGSSNSVSATPFSPNPSAPTITSVTASDRQVTVNWSAGATNGSTISGYRIERSVNQTTWTSANAAIGDTYITISGLTNDTTYYFRVFTLSNAGESPASSTLNAKPFTSPSAPTGVSATAGSGQVSVAWTDGSSNGSTISGYRIEISGNISTWATAASVNNGVTSKVVDGLTNGITYYFRVFTTSSNASDSSASSIVNAKPFTVPDAPLPFTAVAGIRLVDLSWSTPFSGGRDISSYLIQRNITTNNNNWGSDISTNASVNTLRVTGLEDNKRYYFRIYAINIAGRTVSPSLADTTTFNVPGQPRDLSVTPTSNGVVTLTWTAPLSNGGSPITNYSITNNSITNNYSEGTVAFLTAITATSMSATVSGLTNKSYNFSVVATTLVGNSTTPATYSVTPFTTPSAPMIESVIAGNRNVAVTWSAGASNGSTRTGYRIESSINRTNWPNSVSDISSAISKSVIDLSNGTAYYFRVVTLSNAGEATSSPSSAVIPNITPGPPRNLTVTTGNASASLSWNAPEDNGGSAITEYNVISDPSDGTIIINSVERTATVTNLTNGTHYTYRVTATNAGGTDISGTSAESGSVTVTPFTVPSFPTNVRATSRNTQATVSWTAPNNGGSAITSYSVTSSPGNFQLTTADGLTTTVTFSGLTNGTAYSFTVLAINDAGPSNASGASNLVTPIGPPVTNKKIAISNDGKVVAMSSSSYSDISKGRVYVYELSYNQTAYNWTPLGLSSEIIVGLSNEDMFGWDIALSSDGRVVAGSSIYSDASGINCGQVRLFELSNNTNLWKQKGSAINGPLAGSESGYSISLSGNGNRIAIGAWKDSSNGSNAGAVRVYDFSAVINDWRQQGQTLTGDAESYEGYATALSLDGLTLASGCLNVDNANNVINAGQVKTFTWSGTSWNTKGIIQGADISYLYFGRALKLSGNGNSIVIGAPGNILRESEGTAWVYRYQSGTTWTQLGQTLLGISGGDDFGSSVAISNDGTIISVGSDNNSNNRGHVKVFAYANNYWNQVSNTLSGKSASSKAGLHALSGDGTTLIQSNNTYNSVYGINKTLALNAPMTSISGNLLVLGNISVNSLDISDISTNHFYRSDGYSYKRFESDISNAVMKEYYSDVSSIRHLKVQIFGNGDIRNINNSYSSLSDSRLKENILTSGPKLEDLLKVRIVNYNLKGSDPTKYIGVLAQELEDVFPNLVTEIEPSPKDIQEGRLIKYKAVNYSSFNAILIKSLQEQNAMLKNIEKRIIALEDE